MSVITLHQDHTPNAAELVWENPPAKTRRSKYADVAAALKENPGQWAVLRTVDANHKKSIWSMTGHIHSGKYVDFQDPHGRFEACARTINGTTRLYARYVPHVTIATLDGQTAVNQ